MSQSLDQPPPVIEPGVQRRPRVKRHHWLVRVTHWLNAILLQARNDHQRQKHRTSVGEQPDQ